MIVTHQEQQHDLTTDEGNTESRVSLKQTKINFHSNQNKICIGLFHETKNKTFRFVSVFRTYVKTI